MSQERNKCLVKKFQIQDQIDSPLRRFRVEVFPRVIDQICTSITDRFSVNQDLIKDTACLDPRRFKELLDHGIPGEALEKISKLTGLKASDLRAELLTFNRNYDNLSKTLQEEYSENTNLVLSDDDQDEGGQEGEEQLKRKKLVRNLVPRLVQGPAGIASHAATRFFTVTH